MSSKNEPDQPPGAPDWIVTFADMISLLVTFFILLMTFSSMDALEAFQADANLLGTAGTLTSSKGPTAVKPPAQDRINAMDAVRGAAVPHSRPAEELLENMEAMGQKDDDEHVEISLGALKDGISIVYDKRAAFMPGSAKLSEYLRGAVIELARTLENYPYTLVIEGHTDDHFLATEAYADEFALSADRAASVAQTMLEASGLSPLQVQLGAVGSMRPLVDNNTPLNRRKNRRVEIRIVSLSLVRAAALKNAPAQASENTNG
ncbi:MAG: OmpA family protein [bacterium]|nr:hypothetical protein [Planctomycetota bacterium]HIL52439.1 hypothetical protein [Planctomycetota bacterium]